MNIVFVHGWGCDASYWDRVANNLPEFSSKRVNLGFVGAGARVSEVEEPSMFIAHSLGAMWALKHYGGLMRGLVAINGFPCFTDHADPKTLRSMILRLQRTPQKQMEDFWDVCDLPHHDSLHISTLLKGLASLKDWDLKTELENLTCPVMSLVGRNDPILNYDVMMRDWAKYEMHIAQDGGHSLPISHAQWCAEKIKIFINEF